MEPKSKAVPVLLGAAAALVSLGLLWGFMVDDALITARVASQLASGAGYRFNPGGPRVDAVTPLGFVLLLVPFAANGPLGAFSAARWLGVVGWLGAAAFLGHELSARGEGRAKYFPLVAVALSAPLGAWPSSGMETGLVTALCTFALARWPVAPLFAGLAAAWRPELLPFAMALGLGTAFARSGRPGPAIAGWALAIGPAVAVALVRFGLFGSAMPLAVLAKPSTLGDGLRYAIGATILTGVPLLVIAPRTSARLERHDVALLAAAGVHLVSLVLAGGDWMPLYRLIVPVLPAFVLVGGAIAARAPLWATAVRLGLALFASVSLLVGLGPSSRGVWAARSALIDRARPLLADGAVVASLDVGWVGVATPARVVDLAGVTDEAVARLPGGHTEKQLPPEFLGTRDVDVVLALWDDGGERWFRRTDARVAAMAEQAGFVRTTELPLPRSRYRYVLFRRPVR